MAHYHFDVIIDYNRVMATKIAMPIIDHQNLEFMQLKNEINHLTKLTYSENFPEMTHLSDGTTLHWYYCENPNCYLANEVAEGSKRKQDILIQSRHEEATIWCDGGDMSGIIKSVEGVIFVDRYGTLPKYLVFFDARYEQKIVEEEIRLVLLAQKLA
jgi:hypothetical protein